MIFESGRHALRLLQVGHVHVALGLGHLNAPFDVANRLGIFVDLHLVLRSELPLQTGKLLRD